MNGVVRGCYLFFPFLLTLLALVLLIIVFLDQNSTSILPNLYFLRLNTGDIRGITLDGQSLPNSVTNAAANSIGVKAYYDIGLVNYCSSTNANKGPDFCSSRQSGYYFDPVTVLGLPQSVEGLAPSDWKDALNTYRDLSRAMFGVYVASIVAILLTFIFGIASFFFARLTTFLTALLASASFILTGVASGIATAMFTIIAGVIHTKLGKYNITTSFGHSLLAITWAATAAALGAAILFTCGCCCGHNKNNKSLKRDRSIKGRADYERVPEPFGNHGHAQQESVPLHNQSHWNGRTAQDTYYDPYRT